MTIETKEYAQLAAYVYAVTPKNVLEKPPGWEQLELIPDQGDGFSAGVFRRIGTTEIVIAYTGTNANKLTDTQYANLPATLGTPSSQVLKAMLLYERIKNNPLYGDNITFTGHSLGGGLAGLMAVYFNKTATTFDAAPFEKSALNTNIFGINTLNYYKDELARNGYVDTAFNQYNDGSFLFPTPSTFATREANVTGYHLQGEFLNVTRSSFNTIYGGAENEIKTGPTALSAFQLHSMVLLSATQWSSDFASVIQSNPSLLNMVFDKSLYFKDDETDTEKNFLNFALNSEVKAVQTGGQGILYHFSNDMFKLGASLEGLNQAAQNAIIAQGIEWYYWQSNNYCGQEFFTQSGNLLQYTTAQGAGLDGALNKANLYTSSWLATLNSAYGLAYMPIIKTDYEQWNVNGGVNAVTATAKNIDKTQIYIGQAGSDTFKGGNKDDVFFAGGGADTLAGGLGNDSLYGGDGEDTYVFTGTFGNDIIIDSDGKGKIQFDQNKLSGGTRPGGSSAAYVSQDGQYSYVWTGGDLLINGVITVKDFKNKDLGIYLDVAEDPANPATPPVYDPDRSRRLVRLDPLALDLNGDGKINTISSTLSQSYFDFNHDGIAERSGWIALGDGLLTLDENGNNVVDGLDELFGSMQHGVCNMWTGLASCLFTQLSHPKSARIKQELAIF